MTDFADAFIVPKSTTHRQYEALRAFYVEELSSKAVAKRFGYTEGA